MPVVTVQGAHGETVSLTYDTSTGLFGLSNASLAQAIANAITAGIQGGTIAPADNADGAPPSVPAGETGEYVQSQPGVSPLPAGYDDVVVSASSARITGNGDPNEKVLVGSGNLSFYSSGAATGSGTIIGGGGNDLVSIPSTDNGAWYISLGNGDNTITAAGGGADTISTGTGHNQINLGSGNDFVVTAGLDTITASGADTIFAGNSDLVYGGTSLYFVGGSGGSTVLGGSGSDTMSGGGGPDLLIGGAAGNNLITAGVGTATLVGAANGDQLFANGAQAQILYAGGGNETLSGAGASGADTFVGGPGNNYIVGNTSNNTFVAGSGNETINAAPGATNVFDLVKGQAGGNLLVENLFTPSQVALDLSGYGGSTYTPSQMQTANGLVVSLSDGTKITFENIHAGSITNIKST